MDDLVEVLAAWLLGGVMMAVFVLGLLGLIDHKEHVNCLAVAETTGFETRVSSPALTGNCYIKINDQWTPLDSWYNNTGR